MATQKETPRYPCAACGRLATDLAHIKSKGSGGGLEDWNTLRFCRQDHQLQHARGWGFMVRRYPNLKEILDQKGWALTVIFGIEKLRRKDEN